jgi:Tfp pilus assembly protein PilX
MAITLVVTTLLIATLQLVYSGMNSSRVDQNRTNAFQFANGGIDQALYRIDSAALPLTNVPTSCVATAAVCYRPTVVSGRITGFADRVTIGTSTFDIVATKTPSTQDTTWTVKSTGTDPSGRQRSAITTITARPVFLDAFFAVTSLSLVGNQDSPVAYHSSTCPNPTVGCEVVPVPGTMGTNGTLSGNGISHFAGQWAGFDMYGRSTTAAAQAACGGCPAGQVFPQTDSVASVVPAPPSNPLVCPNSGLITGALAPGDYVCDVAVNMTGTITVSGVGNGTGIVRLWARKGMAIAATVNSGQSPSKFQIFEPPQPNGQPWSGDICDSTIFALMDTPGLAISCNGSHQPQIFGSAVVYSYGGTGNHFDFHWDLDTAGAISDGKFTVQNWRECPASASTC